MTIEQRLKSETATWIQANSNWGRWGDDDQRGAVNLITAAKRIEAAATVKSGRTISLARALRTAPGPQNPQPVQHFVRWFERSKEEGGGAGDYVGLHIHGYQVTHLDALCHGWGERGMWGGRDPMASLAPQGARWGGVQHWKDGIVTRGVLLDVARHRGVPYVPFNQPVHADELRLIAEAQGVAVGPGDALVIHCGRDALERERPDWNPNTDGHPGLSVSALRFIRQRDVAMLVWDLMDAQPYELGWPLVPHAALHAFGVPLVDNCALGELADACAAEGRYEFMLTIAPLVLEGGTGSPVNPIALL